MTTVTLARPQSFRSAKERLRSEVHRIVALDGYNQTRASQPGLSAALRARATRELHLASEGLFMRLFRHWERFLENAFVLALHEQPLVSGRSPRSYLSARSRSHCYEILTIEASHPSWARPGSVLQRSDVLLVNGYPIRGPVDSARSKLIEMARLRNRIAHESEEAHAGYRKVLKAHFGVIPGGSYPPGRYLNLTARGGSGLHYLEHYAQLVENLAHLIANG
jgi:hypothetical protein